MPRNLTRRELGKKLESIRSHAQLCNGDEVVYEESNILKLLKDLGYPSPKWDDDEPEVYRFANKLDFTEEDIVAKDEKDAWETLIKQGKDPRVYILVE